MTDLQLVKLHWHKRSDKGEIEIPPAPEPEEPDIEWTLQGNLEAMDMLANMLRLKPEDVAANKEKLKAKYAQEASNGGQPVEA